MGLNTEAPGPFPERVQALVLEFSHLANRPGQERAAVIVGDRLLETLTPDVSIEVWSWAAGLRAQLLIELAASNRAGLGDLDEAIRSYRAICTAYDETRPLDWTWAKRSLAVALLQRGDGTRATLDEAVGALESAANRQGELAEISECAQTLVVLSDVMSRLRPVENWLERSIGLVITATHILAEHPADPSFFAATERLEEFSRSNPKRTDTIAGAVHHALGTAYRYRAVTVPSEAALMLERAIFHLTKEVHVSAALGARREWSVASAMLGNLYRRRKSGIPADNIDMAIEFLQRALIDLPTSDDEMTQSLAHAELAMCFAERPGHSDFDQARASLARAEEQRPSDESHLARVTLVEAQADVAVREANARGGVELWERARDSLLGQLAMLRPEERARRAEVQLQLGGVLSALSSSGEQVGEDVINAFASVLDVYTVEIAPVQRRIALSNLGAMYAARAEWEDCAESLFFAIEASEAAFSHSPDDAARLAEAHESAHVFDLLAFGLARLGRYDDALVAVERGRGRLSGVWFRGEAELDLDLADVERLDAVRREWSRLDMLSRLPRDDPRRPSAAELNDGFDALANDRDRLMSERGLTDLRFATVIDGLAPESVAVVPVVTDFGSVVLAVPARVRSLTAINAVWLTDVTSSTISHLMYGSSEEWGYAIYRAVVGGIFSEDENIRLRDGFNRHIDTLLATISHMVVAPIAERLRQLLIADGAHVVLVPSGVLGTFPFHAVPVGPDAMLLDRYVISYAPSLTAHRVASKRTREFGSGLTSARVVAFVDPQGDLPGTRREAEALTRRFGATVETLAGAAASVDAVVAKSAGATLLHFGCHGYREIGGPRTSGLVLAETELLTLDWIRMSLPLRGCRLVALSSCDSGVTETWAPNESVGFPVAFLEAGSASVLATMWGVSDSHSGDLIARFYELLGSGLSPARALRSAQIEARDAQTDNVPYLWAGYFTVGG